METSGMRLNVPAFIVSNNHDCIVCMSMHVHARVCVGVCVCVCVCVCVDFTEAERTIAQSL